jgi:hypothetical protein
MSDITSTAYPVVTDTQTSDQIPIVRSGNLKKTTISTLQTWINGLISDAISSAATATTANFEDAASSINTTDKYLGKPVFNSTTLQPLWSSGSAATSSWVDYNGSTVYTPA